ncbi:S1 family peptidase [Gemmatimonas sp.]
MSQSAIGSNMLHRSVFTAVLLLSGSALSASLGAQRRPMSPAAAEGMALSAIGGASVVTIVARSASGDTLLRASGVVAGDSGIVVTYGYLLSPDMELTVVDALGRSFLPRGPVARDTVTSVLALRALGLTAPPARLSTRALAAGERVRIFAPRLGLPAGAREGTVLRMETYESGALATVAAGSDELMSGTPVFNLQGELVALGYSSTASGQVSHYAVPASAFRALLQRMRTPAVANGSTSSAPSRPTATQGRQTTVPAARARTVALPGNQLNVEGLANAAFFSALYAGEFEKIAVKNNSLQFMGLFQQYLDGCAVTCKQFLPANRVEMTEQVCTRERVEYNGYGMAGVPHCVEWRTEGRGLYADPRLYQAVKALERQQAADAFGDAVKIITATNPFDRLSAELLSASTLAHDMPIFLTQNACNSAAIKQFENNLVLFSQGKQSIRLAGAENPVTLPFRESDYTWLSDELIATQSKEWALNRYVMNSAFDVTVESRDGEGRPRLIRGSYRFDGLNGRTTGAFTLTFGDGVPECLHYSDAPATCRTVSRQLAYQYLNGRYWLK